MMLLPLQLTVLVTGLLPGKTGKTTIALGLMAGLKERGVKVGFLKPLAFFDYYEDYLAVEASIDEGLLVPPEVLSLREIESEVEDPCLVNPVSVLTAPLRPETFIEARVPASFFSYSANTFKRVAVMRAALLAPVKAYISYINEWALSRNLLEIDRETLKKITRRSDQTVSVPSLAEFTETYERVPMRAVESVLSVVSGRHRVLVVESFGTTAWPLPPIVNVGLVLSVVPGTVLVYRGDRYKMAVSLKAGDSLRYLRRLTTADVFTLLSPSKVVKTPPLSPYEPVESKAEKLSQLVDIVIETLEGG